jgi:hypothetical protein
LSVRDVVSLATAWSIECSGCCVICPFINYHRVLNRDAWSCLAAGQILLGLIVALIPGGWPSVLAADENR